MLLLLLALLFTDNVHAQEGTKDHGGDPKVIRELLSSAERAQIIQDLANEITSGKTKQRVLSWVKATAPQNFAMQEMADMYADMLSRGLITDIENTPIVLQSQCIDFDGVERAAATALDAPGSPICLNLNRYIDDIRDRPTPAEFRGLLMHEYSHHFGYRDDNHHFAAAVALTMPTAKLVAPPVPPPGFKPIPSHVDFVDLYNQSDLTLNILTSIDPGSASSCKIAARLTLFNGSYTQWVDKTFYMDQQFNQLIRNADGSLTLKKDWVTTFATPIQFYKSRFSLGVDSKSSLLSFVLEAFTSKAEKRQPCSGRAQLVEHPRGVVLFDVAIAKEPKKYYEEKIKYFGVSYKDLY